MATVVDLSGNGGGPVGAGPESPLSSLTAFAPELKNPQKIAYTGTATVIANPINAEMVDITCTTEAHIAIGPNPTATLLDIHMTAGVPRTLRCNLQDKVSAIQVSSSGTLHVNETT